MNLCPFSFIFMLILMQIKCFYDTVPFSKKWNYVQMCVISVTNMMHRFNVVVFKIIETSM